MDQRGTADLAQSHHPHLILGHRKWREHLLAVAPSLGTSAHPHTLPPWRASGYKCCCSLASAPKGRWPCRCSRAIPPKPQSSGFLPNRRKPGDKEEI